eukprot:5595359-Ditylum_brightwellii.AAC.1
MRLLLTAISTVVVAVGTASYVRILPMRLGILATVMDMEQQWVLETAMMQEGHGARVMVITLGVVTKIVETGTLGSNVSGNKNGVHVSVMNKPGLQ